MLRLSFGSNDTSDGSPVNRNAMLTAPALLVPRDAVAPGYYAITMMRTDVPYLHWLRVNMPSTIKNGKDVVVYQPPAANAQGRMTFVATLWYQAGGRFSPIPRAPTNLARVNMQRFATRHKLVEVASVNVVTSAS